MFSGVIEKQHRAGLVKFSSKIKKFVVDIQFMVVPDSS